MPAISRDLNVLARCGNQFRSAHLKTLGLTAFQAPYILHICARPGQSQEQLARALHVNRSSAARQLKMLEDGGFVCRQEDQVDKRLLLIYPLDKALAAAPLIRQVNRRWNAWLTDGMSAEETSTMERLLDKVRQRAILWAEQEGTLD